MIVNRAGAAKPITFNLVRDEIPRNSVDTAFWVKPGIAYMRIQSFTETTSHEVEENLKALGEQNIKGLILDLRENPGGLCKKASRLPATGWIAGKPWFPIAAGRFPKSPIWRRAASLARTIRLSSL